MCPTRNLAAALLRFLSDDQGPTATEYAVMLGLVIVVVIGAVTQIGNQLNGIFRSMAGFLG